MAKRGTQPIYRHCGAALLRSAALPLHAVPDRWPDLTDAVDCRRWLQSTWEQAWLVDAIRVASPGLAERVAAICGGDAVPAKQVRQIATSVVRYVLRATGRHTPFGLFAGVAAASVGSTAKARWGGPPQSVARVDTQWLADVVDRLEASPDLLGRLDVVLNNLAIQRGSRYELPRGPGRANIRYTRVTEVVRDIAATPVPFGVAGRQAH